MKRLIPVLLLDRDGRLVKTQQFGQRTYVGDPFNVIRLFNECAVDELCVLDIDAHLDGRGPNFPLIEKIAQECFMPLSYGGGIGSIEDASRLNRFGVEKLVLRSKAHDKKLVPELVSLLGTQALVACLNYRGLGERAVSDDGQNPVQKAVKLETAGFGEIILQSIDRDGMRGGHDIETIKRVSAAVQVPVVALGGARRTTDMLPALKAGAAAAASGSAFTFVGNLRAVLVHYPTPQEARLLLLDNDATST
jgi:imidazole glycerol-phosphate synthase subunit HisF